mmetsp:Transcript_13416/g.22871  ORF Transcript_13416/g.22871 Transcript_13416/m.22871 type:complete len:83 (-) Transcript_13416:750-998(-)
MIAPGIHYQSPWAPMAWRVGDIEYILRRDLDFDVWFEPKRRNAAKLAKNYSDSMQRCSNERSAPTQSEITRWEFTSDTVRKV